MAFKDRSKKSSDDQKIEDFISKADKTENDLQSENLDPKATRTKQLGIKVNEFEYRQLEALAEKLDRSIASTMRYAINKTIREELEGYQKFS